MNGSWKGEDGECDHIKYEVIDVEAIGNHVFLLFLTEGVGEPYAEFQRGGLLVEEGGADELA